MTNSRELRIINYGKFGGFIKFSKQPAFPESMYQKFLAASTKS
jgi:hypothetical protein